MFLFLFILLSSGYFSCFLGYDILADILPQLIYKYLCGQCLGLPKCMSRGHLSLNTSTTSLRPTAWRSLMNVKLVIKSYLNQWLAKSTGKIKSMENKSKEVKIRKSALSRAVSSTRMAKLTVVIFEVII